jgi:hypothetical protein
MKIDKVIFSFDGNPLYSDFWEIQCKLVRKILGAEPVLFYITDEDSDFYFDGNGLVKKINKNNCPDIITSFQSQIIRMFATKYFPEEICLTADIDMLMIGEEYFLGQIKDIDNDDLVIYDSKAYDVERPECQDPSLHCHERYPICYIAGKGKTFNKILGTDESFEEYADKLQKLMLDWGTDEIYFGRQVNNFEHNVKIHKLVRNYNSPWRAEKRIDRHNFPVELKIENEINAQIKDGLYDLELLRNGYYVDVHCPRPYCDYKAEINKVVEISLALKNFMFKLGVKYNTDKVLHHRFDRIYPKFLDNFRDYNIKLFEIGCGAEFASFNMWKEYFPKGQIFCMDINEEIETDRGIVYRGDQTNIEDLQRMVNLIGECEIIIDDGSHIPQHQIDTFNFLFENMLKNGGVYIIEDIECNYWNPKTYLYGYEVGSSNIVDHLQSLPHRINSEFSNFKNHKLISSVTFFKNCIILTKMTSEEIEENKGEYRFKEML